MGEVHMKSYNSTERCFLQIHVCPLSRVKLQLTCIVKQAHSNYKMIMQINIVYSLIEPETNAL